MGAPSPAPTAALRRRAGFRAGLPFALATGAIGVSFGLAARADGVPAAAAIVMSAVVHGGSAQIAAVTIVAAGGSVLAGVVAGLLVNLRFLPMGLSIGPWIPHGPLRRALYGQAVVDASWALSHTGEGRFDRHLLVGSTAAQYVGWVGGTAIGALGGGVIPDPDALGVDAMFPTFFLALLLPELRRPEGRVVALGGAVVALGLGLLAPPGVGIIAAAAVSLVVLLPRWRPAA